MVSTTTWSFYSLWSVKTPTQLLAKPVAMKIVNERDVSYRKRLMSSSVGALLTALLATPLDVVKTRLQINHTRVRAVASPPNQRRTYYQFNNGLMDHLLSSNKGPVSVAHPHPPKQFKGATDTLVRIVRYEGVGKLYSGLAPTIWMSVPATVLYFSTYDIMRLKLCDKGCVLSAPMIAGCSARVLSQTVVSPLELIRTQMQAQTLESGVLKGIRANIQANGFLSLWKGLLPTLWRDVPFSGIYWTGYQSIKSILIPKDKPISSNQIFFRTFLAGAASGACAAVAVTPADVAKTRSQMILVDYLSTRKNTLAILRQVWKAEGLRGIFAGVSARLIRVPPACAIMISSYEVCKCIQFHDGE